MISKMSALSAQAKSGYITCQVKYKIAPSVNIVENSSEGTKRVVQPTWRATWRVVTEIFLIKLCLKLHKEVILLVIRTLMINDHDPTH